VVSSQTSLAIGSETSRGSSWFSIKCPLYQELATSFQDNRTADSQRQKALETALMRDDATYQLLVHRAQNQPELAVPLLVQIIRSQSPPELVKKPAVS